MERILGIDTGTNSLGWAIVEREGDECRLVERGVNIFAEGVKMEKGNEKSKAAERTEHRAQRRTYWRRKVRKVRLLTILTKHHLCPPLEGDALREWRQGGAYPSDEAFLAWQRTEDKDGVNPYRFRHICLTQRLDLTDLTQRYMLGRALYHLNQRRGFLSNRKDAADGEESGKVKTGISELSQAMKAAGCRYLGDYFYQLYERGEHIRRRYTARNEHYLAEFEAICERQQIDDDLRRELRRAIFTQRPLRSQRATVGTCTFEPSKPRLALSHPLYEEFRLWQFVNNIRIETPYEAGMRPLSATEVEAIVPLFKRKSKRTFPFEDIAKKLSTGKNNYCYYKDSVQRQFRFNYAMDTQVSGCPVTAQLEDIFGTPWVDKAAEVYTLSAGKTRLQVMNDVWHALFAFTDDDHLRQFASERLQLSGDKLQAFVGIQPPQGYASLSLKAIRKILPYMRDQRLRYSHAVFLANLCEVVPRHLWEVEQSRQAVIETVVAAMEAHAAMEDGERGLEQCVKDVLTARFGATEQVLKKLYHPSMTDLYPRRRPDDVGLYQLGSPRTGSVRNPMAMHSLFRLRKVVNMLLREGKIDADTTVNIEFARELNDANRRKAIKEWQTQQETKHSQARESIRQLYREQCHADIDPTADDDVRKYLLWEEQEHRCLYTGESIAVSDFLGPNPRYDIEHTIPRSAGGDTTMANLTLCSMHFNREVKRTKLPSQLANHAEILQRIDLWRERAEKLSSQIRKLRGSAASTKEAKDTVIQKRHRLVLERDYWRGKHERFCMTTVPEGFARRQGPDNSVISRYARLYLRSVFRHVYIVKGIATADFRKLWGIQEKDTAKQRDNHAHHCIDAVTIACIGKEQYARLAEYYHADEEHRMHGLAKPHFPKPWPAFAEDMKHLADELLIAHYTQDNMAKHTRRRASGSIAEGDTARAPLHQDTYYGAIMRDGELKYVVRKPLDALADADVDKIVDEAVAQHVRQAISRHGSLRKAIQADDVWMNREKGIPIRKVRLSATTVTRPMHIRQQRDPSRHPYKQHYHVMNDRNYLMAIYIGENSRGKEKREFELVSCMDAATHYRRSNDRTYGLVPQTSPENNYPLAYCLKIGTMVLLYERTPEEVWDLDKAQLTRRLYKVTGLSSMVVGGNAYGTIEMTFHQEARMSTDLKAKNGAYQSGEALRARIKMLHTQFKALTRGVDFELNDLGEIRRLI